MKGITPEAVKYVYPNEEVLNSLYKNAVVKVAFKSGRVQTFAEGTSFKKLQGPEEFELVSITQVESETRGLFKLSEVSSKARGTTSFANMERVKERAMSKLKIEAAIHGANVVYLVQQSTAPNLYGNNSSTPTATNLAGVAYSN